MVLSKLKKELSNKEMLIKEDKKSELKINAKMDYDSISDLISEKLLLKIKENVC